MKVRHISLTDVAHETARCPTRILPHNAGARLDEFVLEFEAREGPHDLVHIRFLITEKSGPMTSAPAPAPTRAISGCLNSPIAEACIAIPSHTIADLSFPSPCASKNRLAACAPWISNGKSPTNCSVRPMSCKMHAI